MRLDNVDGAAAPATLARLTALSLVRTDVIVGRRPMTRARRGLWGPSASTSQRRKRSASTTSSYRVSLPGFACFRPLLLLLFLCVGAAMAAELSSRRKKTAHHRPAIRCEAIRIAYPDKRRHRDTSPFRRRRTWPSFASHATQLLRNAAPSEKRNEKKTATTKQTKNRRLGTGRGWASGGGGGEAPVT